MQRYFFLGVLLALTILPDVAAANGLALGKSAKMNGEQKISLKPTVNYTGKTKKTIYEIRRQAVATLPLLLAGNYEPTASIFNGIAEDKP